MGFFLGRTCEAGTKESRTYSAKNGEPAMRSAIPKTKVLSPSSKTIMATSVIRLGLLAYLVNDDKRLIKQGRCQWEQMIGSGGNSLKFQGLPAIMGVEFLTS